MRFVTVAYWWKLFMNRKRKSVSKLTVENCVCTVSFSGNPSYTSNSPSSVSVNFPSANWDTSLRGKGHGSRKPK